MSQPARQADGGILYHANPTGMVRNPAGPLVESASGVGQKFRCYGLFSCDNATKDMHFSGLPKGHLPMSCKIGSFLFGCLRF